MRLLIRLDLPADFDHLPVEKQLGIYADQLRKDRTGQRQMSVVLSEAAHEIALFHATRDGKVPSC